MVVAGALDGDDEIAQSHDLDRLADAGDSRRAPGGMLDDSWLYENVTIEICEHPFGSGLGTIDGDDAEVLWTDLLDPGVDRSRGLGDRAGRRERRVIRRDMMAIQTPLELEERIPTRRIVWMAGRVDFSLRKENYIPGDKSNGIKSVLTPEGVDS